MEYFSYCSSIIILLFLSCNQCENYFFPRIFLPESNKKVQTVSFLAPNEIIIPFPNVVRMLKGSSWFEVNVVFD